MRELVMLDWLVPKRPWIVFCHHVEREKGCVEGHLGREAADAMDEFAEADGYEIVEDYLDRLVRAAGRTPEDRDKQKKNRDGVGSDLSELETTRVTIRVDRAVKERFKAAAEKSAFDSYGVAFGRALELYCNGGRAARLEDKFSRILDDAEALLAEVADDSDGDGGLSPVDRRTVAVCQELPDQFADGELVETIKAVAGVGSDPSIRKYREKVTERLDVEPHPNNPDLWVPSEVAAENVPEGTPRVCRRPVDLLNRDERVRRIRLEAGREAAARGQDGCLRLSASEIRTVALDDAVSPRSVRDLLTDVTRVSGYRLDDSGQERAVEINVGTPDLDPELGQTIKAYCEGGESEDTDGDTDDDTVTTGEGGEADGDGEETDTVDAGGTGPGDHDPDPGDVDAEAAAELDALDAAARVRTDGGPPTGHGGGD